MNQNELWNAQCFYRQLAARRPINDSFGNLSPSQKDFFENITHYYGRAPQDIQDITADMVAQLQQLVVNLIPLYQIGLRFDVYLVGGALPVQAVIPRSLGREYKAYKPLGLL